MSRLASAFVQLSKDFGSTLLPFFHFQVVVDNMAPTVSRDIHTYVAILLADIRRSSMIM